MRQDQGRAWRGACKTFATLAAEIRICVNVSTANKARMKDLTVACRKCGHSCPHLHRPEQESPRCTTVSGSCQDRDICSRAFTTSGAAQDGARAHRQFQDQEERVSSSAPHNLCLEGFRKSLPQKFHKSTACAKQRHSPVSEGHAPCGTAITER